MHSYLSGDGQFWNYENDPSDEWCDHMHAEVKKRMTNKFIVANLTEEQDGGEPDPFPSAEGAKRQ